MRLRVLQPFPRADVDPPVFDRAWAQALREHPSRLSFEMSRIARRSAQQLCGARAIGAIQKLFLLPKTRVYFPGTAAGASNVVYGWTSGFVYAMATRRGNASAMEVEPTAKTLQTLRPAGKTVTWRQRRIIKKPPHITKTWRKHGL